MRNIYLTGNIEYAAEHLAAANLQVNILATSYRSLTQTLTSEQAMQVKRSGIESSELVVCCVTPKYSLTSEDVFSVSYALGLKKTVGIVSNSNERTPHLWLVAANPHIEFAGMYELIEYIRCSAR